MVARVDRSAACSRCTFWGFGIPWLTLSGCLLVVGFVLRVWLAESCVGYQYNDNLTIPLLCSFDGDSYCCPSGCCSNINRTLLEGCLHLDNDLQRDLRAALGLGLMVISISMSTGAYLVSRCSVRRECCFRRNDNNQAPTTATTAATRTIVGGIGGAYLADESNNTAAGTASKSKTSTTVSPRVDVREHKHNDDAFHRMVMRETAANATSADVVCSPTSQRRPSYHSRGRSRHWV